MMTKEEWLQKALYTPYIRNKCQLGLGFDCYGLIKNYYKNVLGFNLSNDFISLRKHFIKKVAPKYNGDILILYGKPIHAVLYWGEGLCLHITSKTIYPVFEKLTSPEIKAYRAVYEKKH